MSIYVSDKEEIEMLKKWWRENGKFTIAAIVTAVALSAGWRYWQNTKTQDTLRASSIYEQVLGYEGNHQYHEAEFNITSLQTNYAKSPYAALGAMISAQNAVNTNNMDAALQKLDWVITHAKEKDFIQIAKIRKARVLLAMKKFDAGLDVIKAVNVSTYAPLVNEIKGDILIAKGDTKQASAAYQAALIALPVNAPQRSLVQMKYNQLHR